MYLPRIVHAPDHGRLVIFDKSQKYAPAVVLRCADCGELVFGYESGDVVHYYPGEVLSVSDNRVRALMRKKYPQVSCRTALERVRQTHVVYLPDYREFNPVILGGDYKSADSASLKVLSVQMYKLGYGNNDTYYKYALLAGYCPEYDVILWSWAVKQVTWKR